MSPAEALAMYVGDLHRALDEARVALRAEQGARVALEQDRIALLETVEKATADLDEVTASKEFWEESSRTAQEQATGLEKRLQAYEADGVAMLRAHETLAKERRALLDDLETERENAMRDREALEALQAKYAADVASAVSAALAMRASS